MSRVRVLVIDNYDSFVHNLYQRIGFLTGTEPLVVRNDLVESSRVEALAPTHMVLSPGPGNPANPGVTGMCPMLLRSWEGRIPVLGVCLGHQAIGHEHGARIVRAERVVHGKTSRILHDASGVFESLPSPLTVMRYHSLVIAPDSIPDGFCVTARTEDGTVMAIAGSDVPTVGLQFHPESVGTELGDVILGNFLAMTS